MLEEINDLLEYDCEMMPLRSVLKGLLPPLLHSLIKRTLSFRKGYGNDLNDSGGFIHGFESFQAANEYLVSIGSSGYASSDFISKLFSSASLVRDGKAVYERDTQVFEKIIYSWPVLTSLCIAANQGSKTKVIDFGGGLGSTYQQTRKFLELVESKIEWVVIEQKEIAKIGKESFENSELKFVESIDEIPQVKVDLALFSGSLCYLESPYEVIRKIILRSPKFIVLDRTPFVRSNHDSYGVQFVPAYLFRASYPITFFGQKHLFDLLSINYVLVEKWISADQPDLLSTLEGSIWKLRDAH